MMSVSHHRSPLRKVFYSLLKVSIAGGTTLVSPVGGLLLTGGMTSRIFGYNGRRAVSTTRNAMYLAAISAALWAGHANNWKLGAAVFNPKVLGAGHNNHVAIQQVQPGYQMDM